MKKSLVQQIDTQKLNGHKKNNKEKKVAHINKQLVELQKKILQVQNKNSKIIQKIHKAYNFKKKKAFYQQPDQQEQKPQSPIVYYQKKSNNQNEYENISNTSNLSQVPNSANEVQFYSGSKKINTHQNKSVVVDYEKKNYSKKGVTDYEEPSGHQYKSYVFQNLHKTHSDIAGGTNLKVIKEVNSNSRSPSPPPILIKHESNNLDYNNKKTYMRRSEVLLPASQLMARSTFPTSMIDVGQEPQTPRYQHTCQPMSKSYTSVKPAQNIPISPVSNNMQFYSVRNRQINNNYQTRTQRSSKQFQIMQNIIQTQRQHILTLEQELEVKQQKVQSLKKCKSKFKKYANNTYIIFEDSMQNFIQNFVRGRLHQIERYVKKNQNRLHNLMLRLAEQKQEYEFKKYKEVAKIQKNLIRQRIQKEKQKQRERENNDDKHSSSSRVSGRSLSAKKRGITEKSIPKKNNISQNQQQMKKQFEKISSNYENMLKVKNDQIQKHSSEIKKLQRQIFQLQSQNSELKILTQIQKKMKKVQTNPDSSIFDTKEKQYKIKLEEYENLHKKFREDLYEKQNQLKKIEKKMHKITFQAENDKTSQVILELNQKIRGLVQQNQKNSKFQIQIRQLQDIINRKEQIISQKDSQIYLIQSRLKKSQAQNVLKEQRIQDLSRLLKQMHDQEIKSQKSFYQNVVVDNNLLQDFKILQLQLQNKEKEILEIKKQHDINNKKIQSQVLQKTQKIHSLEENIKTLQTKSNQNFAQISQLRIQLDSKNKDNVLEDNIQVQYFEEASSPKFRSESSYNVSIQGRYNDLSANFSAIKEENMEILSQKVQLQGQIIYLKELIEKETQRNNKQRQQMQLLSERIRQLDTYNQELMTMMQTQLNERKKESNQKGQNQDQRHLMNFDGVSPFNFNKLGQSIQPVPMKGSFMYSSWNFSQKDDILLDRSLKFQPRHSNKSKQPNRQSMNALISQLQQKLENAQKTILLKDQLKQVLAKQYAKKLQILSSQSQTKQKVIQKYIKQNQQLRKKNLELYNNINQCSQLEKTLKNQENLEQQSQKKQDNIGEFQAFLQNDPDIQQLQFEQKVAYLEEQLLDHEENNNKLQEMLKDTLQKLKLKEQEKNQLLIELQQKTNTIEDLNDLIELKDLNISSGFSKQGIRRSTLKHSNISANRKISDESINFHLIDEHNPNFLQQSGLSNSMSQNMNMSMIFEKQENFFQRLKKQQTKRKNQSKLFAKTFQYIKSLKTIISEKNKKISILECRLDQLKDNCWLWKKNAQHPATQQKKIDSQQFATHQVYFQNQFNNVNDILECRSQQLDKKKKPHHNKYKRMEYDTKLIIEENKILSRQVAILQEEIAKVQQQEANLMSVKDMYKQQIRFLTVKINQMTTNHQNELKKVRQTLEQGQCVQKLHALKQLLLKISQTFRYMQDPLNKKQKRQQKKKQLQECLKVTFSILQVQNNSINK